MMSLTVGLFTQVSGSGPLGPLVMGSMPLITETQRGFESVPETETRALSLTRSSLMPLVIASSPHSTSNCSRATCHFTRAHVATASSMISCLTTTAV